MSKAQWLARLEAEDVGHPDLDRLATWLDLNSVPITDDISNVSDEEQEHYLGEYAGLGDFAEESMTNAYGYELEALPTAIQNAIDWPRVYDSYLRHDTIESETDFGYHVWHAH